MDRKKRRGALRLGAIGRAALLLMTLAAALPPGPADASESVFAVIDGETVSESQFQTFLLQFARSKFYHRVPEGGLEAVKSEAAEALILQRLLVHEAARRGLEEDPEAVNRQMARLEERYKGTEAWEQIQADEAQLRTALIERSKVSALEDAVRQVKDPGDEALTVFYRDNIERFTEPSRANLKVILIGVPPWETAATWEKARQTAETVAADIIAGASFEEKAREISTHASAAQGGDLGFIHSGMLSASAQEAVDRLHEGELSPPVKVLEGYTLFRLEERSAPQIREFAEVRDRVLKLYQREHSETRWSGFLADLRAKADIVIPGEEGTAKVE